MLKAAWHVDPQENKAGSKFLLPPHILLLLVIDSAARLLPTAQVTPSKRLSSFCSLYRYLFRRLSRWISNSLSLLDSISAGILHIFLCIERRRSHMAHNFDIAPLSVLERYSAPTYSPIYRPRTSTRLLVKASLWVDFAGLGAIRTRIYYSLLPFRSTHTDYSVYCVYPGRSYTRLNNFSRPHP
jgi:hypothetical protein